MSNSIKVGSLDYSSLESGVLVKYFTSFQQAFTYVKEINNKNNKIVADVFEENDTAMKSHLLKLADFKERKVLNKKVFEYGN